jgi:hypothetical protein
MSDRTTAKCDLHTATSTTAAATTAGRDAARRHPARAREPKEAALEGSRRVKEKKQTHKKAERPTREQAKSKKTRKMAVLRVYSYEEGGEQRGGKWEIYIYTVGLKQCRRNNVSGTTLFQDNVSRNYDPTLFLDQKSEPPPTTPFQAVVHIV